MTEERCPIMPQPGRLLKDLMEARIPLLPALLLSGGFAAMLIRDQKQLARVLQQERLLLREVEIAREIQLALLAAPLPHPCFEIAVHFEPAAAVGGDFYSFFTAGTRMGVIVGDVSGKGIPAALVATSISHLARWLRPMEDPDGFLAGINRDLLEQLPAEAFASMVAAFVDPEAEELVIYNAGHPPGLHLSGQVLRRVQQPNMPLGMFPDVEFVPETFPFRSGDTLVLYSDAFIEARNRAGKLLEVEGLEALVRRHAALPPEDLARRLIEETRAFGEMTDDLTLVVIRHRSAPDPGFDPGERG